MAINASHCLQGKKQTCYGGSNTDVLFLLKIFFLRVGSQKLHIMKDFSAKSLKSQLIMKSGFH